MADLGELIRPEVVARRGRMGRGVERGLKAPGGSFLTNSYPVCLVGSSYSSWEMPVEGVIRGNREGLPPFARKTGLVFRSRWLRE